METEDITYLEKILTPEEISQLAKQNSRLVSDFVANKLEIDARKHWDLFYKRNETRFFKDRHWTTREFQELLDDDSNQQRILFEVGCGVGNLIFPLIKEKLNFKIIACDLSPRAVELTKKNKLYDESCMRVFEADITTEQVLEELDGHTVDIVSLIFVLSAIHPDKFVDVLRNLNKVLRPGGVLLFRDYGLYDMAQLRFKAGSKIAENFYVRHDGTRTYYFSIDFINELVKKANFQIITSNYVLRRTINKKENIDVPRIFLQGKFRKPL